MALTSLRIDMPPAEVKALTSVLEAGGATMVTVQAGESRRNPGSVYGQILMCLPDVPATVCENCKK